MQIYDVEAGKLERRERVDIGGGVAAVRAAPDGQSLAVATASDVYCVRLGDADNDQCVQLNRPLRETRS